MSTPNPPIRILLVDDHAVVLAGLQTILGGNPRLQIVGTVSRAADVLPAVEATRPGVVLLDVRLPDGSGTALARELKALADPPRVAILTSFAEPVEVFAALEAGVDGYLLKESNAEGLVAALVAIAAGEQVLHPHITRMVMGSIANGSGTSEPAGRLDVLTGFERRLLALVTEGRTNKEIGVAVGLSEKSVRNKLTVVFSKLGVERRQQAVALFVEEQSKDRARMGTL